MSCGYKLQSAVIQGRKELNCTTGTECWWWSVDLLNYSTVLLDKLTGSQPVKKFPTLYGIRMFITAVTRARNMSLSWACSIQSIHPHPTSRRSTLILSSHLCLGLSSGLFPSGFLIKFLYMPLPSPNALHAPPISFFLFWSPLQYSVSRTNH